MGLKPPAIKPICHINQLHSIRKEWDTIFHKSSRKSYLLSFDYISHWYNCFAKPGQVRIYRAINNNGKTIGFLPLRLHCPKPPTRVLTSLTNEHCLLSEPLVIKGDENIFPELILENILQDKSSWDVLQNSFSYSFSLIPGLFLPTILSNIPLPWHIRIQPTYIVSLNKSFQNYLKNDASPNTKKNFMRIKNRLTRAGSFRIKHYQGKVAQLYWPEFVRIEDSGWKGKEGSSIKKLSPAYQEYYHGLIAILSDKNALNIFFLEFNNQIIAGVFGYIDGETFHWAKTGYDEHFKEFAPSNLLLLFIIEELITNFPQTKIFHMFPWDYGYKHRFANVDASCFETLIFNSTFRGKLASYTFNFKEKIKSILKSCSKNSK